MYIYIYIYIYICMRSSTNNEIIMYMAVFSHVYMVYVWLIYNNCMHKPWLTIYG